jgi:hypothetical protein
VAATLRRAELPRFDRGQKSNAAGTIDRTAQ